MTDIENAVIKYAIDFEKYKNGQANQVIEFLDKANEEIAKFIKQTSSVATKKRYKEISAKLNEVSKALKNKVEENIDIDGVLDYELKKQKKILGLTKKNPAVKKLNGDEINFIYPTLEQLKTASLFKPIDTKYGLTYQSYLEGIQNGLYNTWDSAVRTGYLTGMSTGKVVKTVMGSVTPSLKITQQGSMTGLRNSIYANTRTALQSFANETRNRIYEENEEFLGKKNDDKFEYLATLDNRTCLVCGNLDGKLFKSIKECPQLPQHRGCRCVIVPYFNIEGDTRASKNGYVDSKTHFDDWLEVQDEKTQIDVLGKTRYKMFQDGVKISQFVDNGRVLTIEELNETLEE